MISRDSFRDEVIRQLEDDILSFGWLRQIAELEIGFPVGISSRRAVFDLACSLVDSGIAVVGDAKNDGKMTLVYPWCERGEALKERMAGAVDAAPSEDQDWVFWLQLSAHHQKKMKTIVSLIALTLVCGCASTVPPANMSAAAPVTTEKATVYVIQGSVGIVSESVPVFVSGEKIGALSLRSYTWFQCAPGIYRVAIGDSMVSHRMVAASGGPVGVMA